MDPTTSRMMSGATESVGPLSILFYPNITTPTYAQSIVITWDVTNSANQSIDQGIGSVGASGALSISSPTTGGASAQRTYLLTALGLDGSTSSSSFSIYWRASTGTGYVNCPWPSPWDAYFCSLGLI